MRCWAISPSIWPFSKAIFFFFAHCFYAVFNLRRRVTSPFFLLFFMCSFKVQGVQEKKSNKNVQGEWEGCDAMHRCWWRSNTFSPSMIHPTIKYSIKKCDRRILFGRFDFGGKKIKGQRAPRSQSPPSFSLVPHPPPSLLSLSLFFVCPVQLFAC
jgi:hypothetical protein